MAVSEIELFTLALMSGAQAPHFIGCKATYIYGRCNCWVVKCRDALTLLQSGKFKVVKVGETFEIQDKGPI